MVTISPMGLQVGVTINKDLIIGCLGCTGYVGNTRVEGFVLLHPVYLKVLGT